MRILVTNDDGIHSAGIRALSEAIADVGDVWVVAPDRERSGASHSITLHSPLRLTPQGPQRYMVDGTPGDCVYLTVNHLLKDARPDLVVSGINHGPNLADDITYSGTVAAALEATMLGIPAIAFSLCPRGGPMQFEAAARFARTLISSMTAHRLPKGTLLNVNVPRGSDGVTFCLTRQGKRSFSQEVVAGRDPRGKPYYWIGGDEQAHENIPGSDCNAVYDEGVISVTPLHLDMTHVPLRTEMEGWGIPGQLPHGGAP